MEFKQREDGSYWPPIIPNGKFYAKAVGQTRAQHLFSVTATGLVAGGINYNWSELAGISIQGDEVQLVSYKYPSGGFRFVLSACMLEDEQGRDLHTIDGYTVDYCLLNRITFESMKLGR